MNTPDLRLNLSEEEIRQETHRLVKKLQEVPEKVIKTNENPFEIFLNDQDDVANVQYRVGFPTMVHKDGGVRKASSEGKDTLKKAFDELYSNKEVYQVLKAYNDANPIDGVANTTRQKILALFKRNAVHLQDDIRQQVAMVRAEIVRLEGICQGNVNEDSSFIYCTLEQLEGLPQDWLDGLEKVDNKYKVSTKPPDVLAVVQNCKVEETRKRILTCSHSKCCGNNLSPFAQLLRARTKAAQLMGYKCWADYRLEPNMTNTQDKVREFLQKVLKGVEPKRDQDIKDLKDLKGADVKMWDLSYLERELRMKRFNVNDELIREYFPTDHVLAQILEIYQELLSLKFVPNNDPTWHEEVKLYTVYDESKGKLLGYFALDLFPRDGKYAHQCVVPVQPSTHNMLPVACNVGNLSKATPSRPAMLSHIQVRTFFHEFGHVIHHLLTGVDAGKPDQNLLVSWGWSIIPYPVELSIDFLECPSQALENWIWEKKILKRLSKHYQTGESLPDDMIDGLSKSRWLMSGYFYSRQAFMSLFDLEVHCRVWTESDQEIDAELRNMWKTLALENVKIDPLFEKLNYEDAKTTPSAGGNAAFQLYSWYHPIMYYDSAYSSYLLSEVFAHDLYSLFAASPKGCMDLDLGMRYRRSILEPGARRHAMDLLRDFLQREPSEAAFLKVIS